MSSLPWRLQAKLEVGSGDDPLEREADRVAEQVMRMPDRWPLQNAMAQRVPVAIHRERGPTLSGTSAEVQRKCACGGSGSCDECKSEQPDDEHPKVQRKPAALQISSFGPASETSGMLAPPIVHEVLRSPGQPLDPATLSFFEPRFGHDFSKVRLHAGPKADESARDLDALAYTVGSNVVLAGRSATLPISQRHQLLAHELAHVIQQTSIRERIQRQPKASNAKETEQTSIVKIVAHEDSDEAGVATLSTGETTQVTILQNCYPPGDYTLKRIAESPHYKIQTVRKQLAPAKKPSCTGFMWLKPKVYVWADLVRVIIIPEFMSRFFTAERGERATAKDSEVLQAEEILTSFGVTEDELFLEKERSKDAEEIGRAYKRRDPVDWALSFVAKRREQQEAALTRRETLNSAKERLASIHPDDVLLATTYFTDPSLNGEAWYVYSQRRGGDEHLPGTDFENRKDLLATLDQFAAAFDKEMRALTEATLTSTEVAILKVMEAYVGRWSRGVGPGYLERELNKARENPEIDALRKAIREEEKNPRIDGTSLISYYNTTKEHEKRLDALNKRLATTLGEKSNLKVTGLKGFDAYQLLAANPSHAQFLLGQVLADGRRTVSNARKRLYGDSRFVYGADKIIAAEKRLIGIEPGSQSSLDQIIDALVSARLSEKSTWEQLWGLIDFLINVLPIPPPAGVVLRAISAGIDIGKALDEYAQQSLSYQAALSSQKPSATGLAATVLFTAAGTVVDAASVKMLTAEKKGLTLGLDETGAASAAAHGVQPEGALAKDVAGQDAGQAAKTEGQLGKGTANVEGAQKSIADAEKYLEEHPPGPVEGTLPGKRHAHAGEHDVVEVMDGGHIHCELHSPSPYEQVPCPRGMGESAALEHEERSDVEPRTAKQAGVTSGEAHHIATIYGDFGKRNKAIFKRAGMSVNDEMNLIEDFMEHRELRGWYKKVGNKYKYMMKGHHEQYHEWVTHLLESNIPKGITEGEAASRLTKILDYLSDVLEKHPDVLQYGTDVFAGKTGKGGPPPFRL